MSTFAKNKSIIRKTLAEERLPNVVSRTMTFMHQASGFVSFIDLNNLTVPTEAASEGFSNPGSEVFPYLRLYRQNISVETSYKGKLQDYSDYRIVNNEKIQFINLTTEPGEVFVIKLVLPNNVDVKNLQEELSNPVNILNNAKYGVATVPSKVSDMLSPVITDILTYVSGQNSKKFESVSNIDSITTPSASFHSSTHAFAGGVLLPDGRVFCVPYSQTSARIYSPVTDTSTTISGFPGGGAFVGGVLMTDGRVFCVPYNSTTAIICNTTTNTTTSVSGFPGGSAFVGGVLLPDGRVFCVPYNHTSAIIYNPTTNTTTSVSGFPGSGAFVGGVLMTDGRVFCVPYNHTSAIIYNPTTNTTTSISGFPGSAAFAGGVLLPDGRVFCVPQSQTSAIIYNPITNTTTSVSGFPGSTAFYGGVLMPDGRVFCVPHNQTSATIYDPVTNTTTTVSGFPGSEGYVGGVLLPDGRVICIPFNPTTTRILAGNFSKNINDFQLPKEIMLSPFLNKL
jgi:hypothetical protein